MKSQNLNSLITLFALCSVSILLTGCLLSDQIAGIIAIPTGNAPANSAPTSNPVSGGSNQTNYTGETTLKSFYSQNSDPKTIYGDLTLSGNTLYGMSSAGGISGSGTIFKIGIDGSSMTVIHEFNRATDGASPYGAVTIFGTTLYGMTSVGGVGNSGTVFSMNLDGTDFTVLYAFSGDAFDGGQAWGNLFLNGSTLYGLTSLGGAGGSGTAFSIEVNGSNFNVLHSFLNSNTDGGNPYGSLTSDGNLLYGMTSDGGANNTGTIFSMYIDGSNYQVLYSFGTGTSGSTPYGSLLFSGGMLYGMTSHGGANQDGSIFSIAPDGANYSTLYSFNAVTDGANPSASLILSGNTLYGTTVNGISGGTMGAVFSITTTGNSFTVLKSFNASSGDGDQPDCSLVLSNGVLYGSTMLEGDVGYGTLFSLHTEGSDYTELSDLRAGSLAGSNPAGDGVISGSKLYGMTAQGGSAGYGVIFSMGVDGSSYAVLHSFLGNASDGRGTTGNLIVSGNTLYGMTSAAGAHGNGTIFSIGMDGSNYTVLYSFVGDATDGGNPNGSLVISGTTLYGMALGGGAHGNGTIFSISTTGAHFTLLYSFAGNATDGASPEGSLILSGNILYGMANYAGSGANGSVFSIHTDGTLFTELHGFTGGADGGAPSGSLVLSGNTLYGMTPHDGNSDGTIFSVNTDGTGYEVLYHFTGGYDGSNPLGSLLISGHTLYGTANSGGGGGSGAIFSIHTDGTQFSTLYSFVSSASAGTHPSGSLILYENELIGMTSSQGLHSGGAVFELGL